MSFPETLQQVMKPDIFRTVPKVVRAPCYLIHKNHLMFVTLRKIVFINGFDDTSFKNTCPTSTFVIIKAFK
jgi:hypothetical protein